MAARPRHLGRANACELRLSLTHAQPCHRWQHTSAHCYGLAIDFTAPAFGDTRKVARYLVVELKEHGIKFDQLILEFPDSPNSWIHLGYKHPNGRQRGQVLTAVKRGGRTVYLSGLR